MEKRWNVSKSGKNFLVEEKGHPKMFASEKTLETTIQRQIKTMRVHHLFYQWIGSNTYELYARNDHDRLWIRGNTFMNPIFKKAFDQSIEPLEENLKEILLEENNKTFLLVHLIPSHIGSSTSYHLERTNDVTFLTWKYPWSEKEIPLAVFDFLSTARNVMGKENLKAEEVDAARIKERYSQGALIVEGDSFVKVLKRENKK